MNNTHDNFEIWSARIWIFFTLLFSTSLSFAQLVHPGGWHSQEDLTTIRNKISANEEPWITGWNEARGEGPDENYRANVSSTITGRGDLQNQGEDAYRLAMKWVASGDQKYADAAIDVINDWVETVNAFDIDRDVTLRLGIGSNNMAQAAEILAHGFNGEAGWAQSEIQAARVWFKDTIYDVWTNTGPARSSNFGTAALSGNMSMAIFCDDQAMLDEQVTAYQVGYLDTDDGCCGVAQYIFSPTGQAFETSRDQAHVQGGIAHLVETALSAWNQGIDLVSYKNNRLLAGVEYHAKFNSGNDDVPFTTNIYNPCNIRLLGDPSRISEVARGYSSPMYFMCDKLFTQAGLAHPYVDNIISDPEYLPEGANSDHPGHGQFAFVAREFVPNPLKTYYIDSPHHNLSLGATGEGNDPFTVNTSTIGEQVEWIFVDKGNGSWHIQLAAGGSRPRLRSRNNGESDMQSTGSMGQWTYYDFTIGALPNTYFATLPDHNPSRSRLQIDNNGSVNFVAESSAGTWESFQFTEVPNKIVQIRKRNSSGFGIDGSGQSSNGQNVYLWSEDETNVNQLWEEIYRGDGYYSYQKLDSFHSLDGGNNGAPNQNVYLWETDADNQNQHWSKEPAGDGTFMLVKRNTNFAINGGNDGARGQNVDLLNTNSNNQDLHWIIE